jgi:hypothetical protein
MHLLPNAAVHVWDACLLAARSINVSFDRLLCVCCCFVDPPIFREDALLN